MVPDRGIPTMKIASQLRYGTGGGIVAPQVEDSCVQPQHLGKFREAREADPSCADV
jgi:hypothetical protein